MNTFTVKHPYNSPGHIALVEALEDRKIVQHAGRSCVVLSRKTTGDAELVTSFELAYLASEQAERPGLVNTFTGLDDQAKAKIVRGTPSFTQPDHRDRALASEPRSAPPSVHPLGRFTPGQAKDHHTLADLALVLEAVLRRVSAVTAERITRSIPRRLEAAALPMDVGAASIEAYRSECEYVDLQSLEAPEQAKLEQPEREPVAVVLGSADSLGSAVRAVVIVRGDDDYWYTRGDTLSFARAGRHFLQGDESDPLALSPATDAMLTAYFGPRKPLDPNQLRPALEDVTEIRPTIAYDAVRARRKRMRVATLQSSRELLGSTHAPTQNRRRTVLRPHLR